MGKYFSIFGKMIAGIMFAFMAATRVFAAGPYQPPSQPKVVQNAEKRASEPASSAETHGNLEFASSATGAWIQVTNVGGQVVHVKGWWNCPPRHDTGTVKLCWAKSADPKFEFDLAPGKTTRVEGDHCGQGDFDQPYGYGRFFGFEGCNIPSTPTNPPVVTKTPSPSPVVTKTPSPSPVVTKTPSPSPVVTETPSPSPVVTETPSPSPVVTETPTATPENGTVDVIYDYTQLCANTAAAQQGQPKQIVRTINLNGFDQRDMGDVEQRIKRVWLHNGDQELVVKGQGVHQSLSIDASMFDAKRGISVDVYIETNYKDGTGWHGQKNPKSFSIPRVPQDVIDACAPVNQPSPVVTSTIVIDITGACAQQPGTTSNDLVGGGRLLVDDKPVANAQVTLHHEWGTTAATTDANGFYGYSIQNGRWLKSITAEYNGVFSAPLMITSEMFTSCTMHETTPNGAISDGHPEYAGTYLGTIQLDNHEELPLFQAVYDTNNAPVNPGKGFAKSNAGNITGHYNQGGTMVGEWLKNATTVTIRYTSGEVQVYSFGGSFEPRYGDPIPQHAGLAIATSNWSNGWTGTDLFRSLIQ